MLGDNDGLIDGETLGEIEGERLALGLCDGEMEGDTDADGDWLGLIEGEVDVPPVPVSLPIPLQKWPLPMVRSDWLLYSAVIHVAERTILDILASATLPTNDLVCPSEFPTVYVLRESL